MKLRRLLSAAVAVSTVAAVAVTASAKFLPLTDTTDWVLAEGNGNYGILLYSDGTTTDRGIPVVNAETSLGIDLTKVSKVEWTIFVPDDDEDSRTWFVDGNTSEDGGDLSDAISLATVFSVHSHDDRQTYNWNAESQTWGVADEALGTSASDDESNVPLVKVDDYTYTYTSTLTNPIGTEGFTVADMQMVRIFCCAWGGEMYNYSVIGAKVFEGDTLVATFDMKGNPTYLANDPNAAPPADNGDDSTPDAPSTPAPSTPADPDKGTPNTGVEGVAAAAGLAVVAAGAVVLSKKRK